MNITRHSLSQLRLHNQGLREYRTSARLSLHSQEGLVVEYSEYLDSPIVVDLAASKVLIGSAYCRILAKHAWRPHDYC